MNISELQPDPENANKGTQRGESALEQSITQYGLGRSILIDKHNKIIAGNKTAQKAGELGIEQVTVVDTTGSEIVAVRRTDLDLAVDNEARELAYADNRTSELSLDWDPDQLLKDFDRGINLPFTNAELEKLTANDDFYTQKAGIPVYEPSEKKPELVDLFDDSKSKELIGSIRASNVPEAEKDFLILAAGRHAQLNFELIADYYAHSDIEAQELMEENALVIVDFDKALENGWVRLSERMAEQYEDENAE